MQNPFTLTFGKNPLLSISRPEQTSLIIDSFTADIINEPIYMITGVRGSGKTVMMTEIASLLDKKGDWVIVELNPSINMLESLISKLYSHNLVNDMIKKAKIDLSFFGFGISISGENQVTDYETAIIRILESIKKKGKRLLILIDEAINSPEMRLFASSFQIFVRKELPVCLLMTGLYDNIDNLQNENNLTFLHRAPKITPNPLGKMAMARTYQKALNVDDITSIKMADLTKGYSFAFQVLGYLTFEKGSYEDIIPLFEEYLEDYVYDKLWSELSPKDKRIVLALANNPDGKIKNIRDEIGLTSDEFNPYRKRLIKKGIINGETRGYINFLLPSFDIFAKFQMLD